MFKYGLEKIDRGFRKVLLGLVMLYQKLLRPMIGPRCRFHPHCSEYACQSLKTYNSFYALWLIGKRLLKCHPLCKGGHDPVPVSEHNQKS